MKRKPLQPVTVFYSSDLPTPQGEYGFSQYRDVLVQWDEDEDGRVLTFIDNLPDLVRNELLVVQEHEACLSFLWKTHIPSGYGEGCEFEVEGDIWSVSRSKEPEI